MAELNFLLVTNNYPSDAKNESSIVKSYFEAHKRIFPNDGPELILLKTTSGKKGYLGQWASLARKAKRGRIVLIHFGGMYAFAAAFLSWLRGAKVVLVFHGTDIHGAVPAGSGKMKALKIRLNQLASFLSIFLVRRAEFVSDSLIAYVPAFIRNRLKNRLHHHQLSVDYKLFAPIDKPTARRELDLDAHTTYFLFFNNNKSNIKRPDLAREIVERLGDGHKLLEVSNVPFERLPLYYASADFLLITSDNEGSPNVVRESLAMNLPVLSRDIGDVKEYLRPFKSCLIIPADPAAAAEAIVKHLSRPEKAEDIREQTRGVLDLDTNVRKYREVLIKL